MAENAFRYNVVTYDGLALIAQATSANPIVIVGVLSTERSCDSESELAAKDASWYNGRSGVIESSSATSNRARIVGKYNAEGLRQNVRSVCITARLQNSQSVVILCAKSDPDSTVTIPGEADTGQQAYFTFTIDIASQGVVEVTPGASASLADLDRFVSMYAAGNPTQGEEQTVLGKKTFGDACEFSAAVAFSGAVSFASTVSFGANVYFAADCSIDGTLKTSNIVPLVDGAYSLGSSENGFVNLYVEEAFIGVLYGSAGNPIIAADNVVPKQGQNLSLGTSSAIWSSAYIESLTLGTSVKSAVFTVDQSDGWVNVTGSGGLYINGGIQVSKGVQLNENLLPYYDENSDIGSGDPNDPLRFDNVWAILLHGRIPTPANATDEPEVGSIFWAGISVQGAVTASVGTRITVGQPIGASANVIAIGPAIWDSDAGNFSFGSSFATSDGTYRLLCGISKSSGAYCYAQVMRVA